MLDVIKTILGVLAFVFIYAPISLIFGYVQICFLCALFGFPLWRKTKDVLYGRREKIVKHNRFDM